MSRKAKTELGPISTVVYACSQVFLFFKILLKKKIVFIFREEGREEERERNINVLVLLHNPPLGTRPITQACALTRN